MRPVKGVCLCLLAIVAPVAAFASSAQAAEVGECIKQAKPYKGGFNDKSCQEVNGTKEGKYEFSPGTTPANSVYATKAKATFLSGPTGELKCSQSSSAGKWTGAKTQETVVTFRGCEATAPFSAECHSSGAEPGEIVTKTLAGTLLGAGEKADGYKESTVGAGEVWDQLQAPGGVAEYQAEYLCGGIEEFKTKGESAGVYAAGSLNVASKKAELNWTRGGGDQSLLNDGFGANPFENAPGTEEALNIKSKGAAKLVIKS